MLKDIGRYFLLRWFKSKYKGTKVVGSHFSAPLTGFYSQAGQDAFIYSEFFQLIDAGRIPKIFLDIGCNNPIKFSNSYFFEKNLGYKCIAVDPLPTYASEWKLCRPNSVFHNIGLSSFSGELSLSVPDQHEGIESNSHSSDMFATMDSNNVRLSEGKWKKLNVAVVTAQELLNAEYVSEVGIASIDVEGYEMEVLKGFDFVRTKIYILIVENNSNNKFGSDEIRNFMTDNSYIFYARFWGLDDVFIHSDLLP